MNRQALWLGLALGTAATAGPSGGSYEIPRSTVDGGGARLAAGAYVLHASVGQPDAGPVSGATFSLSGGFQIADGALAPDRVFADGFE